MLKVEHTWEPIKDLEAELCTKCHRVHWLDEPRPEDDCED